MRIVSLFFLVFIFQKGYGQIGCDSIKLYQYYKTETLMTLEGSVRDTVYVNFIRLSKNQSDSISLILSSAIPHPAKKSEIEAVSMNMIIYNQGQENRYFYDSNYILINLTKNQILRINDECFTKYLKRVFRELK